MIDREQEVAAAGRDPALVKRLSEAVKFFEEKGVHLDGDPKTWCEYTICLAEQYGLLITPEAASYILWEETPYPFSGFDSVSRALHEYFDEYQLTFLE